MLTGVAVDQLIIYVLQVRCAYYRLSQQQYGGFDAYLLYLPSYQLVVELRIFRLLFHPQLELILRGTPSCFMHLHGASMGCIIVIVIVLPTRVFQKGYDG